MWNKKKMVLLCLGISILPAIWSVDYFFLRPKIGYVDIGVLFEEFDMKKELSESYEMQLKKIQVEHDSLANVVQSMKIQSGPEVLEKSVEFNKNLYLLKNLIEAKRKLEEEDLKIIDSQIQARISEYLNDFADKKDLDILLLSHDDYPVISVSDQIDLTDEAKVFINNIYNGN